MTEMVIADFNSTSVAEAAIRDLEDAQIPSAAVKSYSKDEPSYQEYRTRQPEHQGGFWSRLIGEEPTQTQEYGAYDTSLASGHTVVTVTVDELHADAVMGILNQHGPRELHEQASGGSETYQTGAYPAAQTASTSRVNGGKERRTDEEVIPLAEEELQVGKRTVDRGTTSIRRYVVRKPVEESVTLARAHQRAAPLRVGPLCEAISNTEHWPPAMPRQIGGNMRSCGTGRDARWPRLASEVPLVIAR